MSTTLSWDGVVSARTLAPVGRRYAFPVLPAGRHRRSDVSRFTMLMWELRPRISRHRGRHRA